MDPNEQQPIWPPDIDIEPLTETDEPPPTQHVRAARVGRVALMTAATSVS